MALMLAMSALLVGREAYNMVMHRPAKTKTLNLLVEVKALVIVLILVALLAAYMIGKAEGQTLPDYLNTVIFHGEEGSVMQPDAADVEGFETFMKDYKAGLAIERAAVEQLR